ncbi:MAG TPA: protein kinase [Gemmatimonadales bacterium]|nr:protein kinase [Gemmatimonadales bacterium]
MTELLDRLRAALGDRYAIERQIGEGGMATVYRAKDLKHERTVAIKVLRQELSASLGADRFLREIRVAANLQHPNILGLYDSGEADGLLYYVMPFVEGESLRDRLKKEQQLPLHDALQITRESAEALQYAHERGIVHRDIKPENILLLGGHALVADFGIARAVSQASEDKLTQTGMAIGTPHYMSPEQALGSEHVDARSDVYSLGCVLYELLIGQTPFTGPNSMAIMARHSMEVVPSLQVVRASIPDEVEDAVMQALEKTPADRFQTMREFAERLSEAETEAAMMRTAQRRASTAARRAASGAQPRATGPNRRTGSREVPATTEHRTPVELAAAVIREGGVKLWSLAAGALVVAAALGYGGWKLTHRGGAADDGGGGTEGYDANHIAVLYFEPRGGSDSVGYLADGLTEALIHEIGQVPQLQVISRNGVLPYKKSAVATDSIGRALKVGTLVQGTVTQADNRLRVDVSLINAATGKELGSKVLERPREEIFALQDDLAKEVSVFLRQQLGQELTLQASRQSTKNPKAWEQLQRAEQSTKDVDVLLASGDTAAAGRRLLQADTILAGAEALDPTWSAPSVMRGWLDYRQTDLVSGFDKAVYAKWLGEGLTHADRALKLKPNDPDALELRGTLRYWRYLINLEPDPQAATKLLNDAQEDLQGAVAGNPTAATAWSWLSHMYMGQARTGEAKLAAQRAYEADPYLSTVDVTIWRLFQASLELEDKEQSAHWCEVAHERFPKYYRSTECQLWMFALKGVTPDVPKAWALLDTLVQLSPASSREFAQHQGQMLVAIALARAGLKDSAGRVAERARADATVDPTRDLAQIEAAARLIMGDKDEALRLLTTYVAANPQVRASMAKDDSWWWRDLRSDPRWRSLMGLPAATS